MKKIQSTHALIIPNDSLFNDVSLKRLLLFFDYVSLIPSCDNALIHVGEVSERFVDNNKNMVLGIGERAPFPKVQNYDESFSDLIAKTTGLQKMNLLRVMPQLRPGLYDYNPLFAWSIYNGAIRNEFLVRNAIPDIIEQSNPLDLLKRSFMLGGFTIELGNHKSRFDEKGFESTFRIPELKDEWSILSHFRIARAVKALLYAHLFNCCPIALDEANANILTAFFTPLEFFAPNDLKPNIEQMIDFSITMDVVDSSDLEEKLKGMSFKDVLSCREKILPSISKARDHILHHYRGVLKDTDRQPQEVRHKMQIINEQFVQYQEMMVEAWESLKIGVKISAGATTVLNLSFYPSFHSWHSWALNYMKSLGGTTLSLYPSIRKYLTTRNNVKKHPLRFIYQAMNSAGIGKSA